MRPTAILALFMLLCTESAFGQVTAQHQFETAYDQWDAGKYPDAIKGFQSVLKAPDGDDFLEDIALVTGELYHTTEVAPHGTNLQWSPDGRYAAYSTGSLAGGDAIRHIISWQNGKQVAIADIPSLSVLTFSSQADKIAFLMIPEDTELDAARTMASELRAARDFTGWRNQLSVVRQLEGFRARIFEQDLKTGVKREIELPEASKLELKFTASGMDLLVLAGKGPTDRQIYLLTNDRSPVPLTGSPGDFSDLSVVAGGRYLVYSFGKDQFRVHDLQAGRADTFEGTGFSVSSDGSTLAYYGKSDGMATVNAITLGSTAPPRILHQTEYRVGTLALSPKGDRVVYQMRPREDWELYVASTDGTENSRLTNDIQHDLFPRYMKSDLILGIIGEGRHRRSFVYDTATGTRTRLFHNNTIRTVAPEYEWSVSPDGARVLIVSERDGDTISPERGVYLVDLNRKLIKDEITSRLDKMLAGELDLRQRGREMFEVIDDDVRQASSEASITRLYAYAKDLHSFGTKYIGEPGNRLAITYLTDKLKSFGYEVEQQWFEPKPGIESANVIATLKGAVDPDLVYVISSHFDSSQRGPGADDNSSGTTVLLETARVLSERPMAATVKFAFFTGEEAGLLGSRYYVKKSAENNVKLLGALNNDMVGWANNHRLDDTIRYSNVGIRDVQHAAAFLFSNLITYDAKYYKSTDAHAYYDEYGDIVGGIGSYPILSSPHYHQSHDVLEIINHQLVTEVTRTTIGTIMLLASSPSRLTGLQVDGQSGTGTDLKWDAAVEGNASEYLISYQNSGAERIALTTSEPMISISGLKPGSEVRVKAINDRDMTGWDWARITIE
ncbi:MAG: M28 family peptidase [Candidatus Latescibacteria bacterium]|nr:M28 family peptidase [Candidatus Latescibacterota bacterium]